MIAQPVNPADRYAPADFRVALFNPSSAGNPVPSHAGLVGESGNRDYFVTARQIMYRFG